MLLEVAEVSKLAFKNTVNIYPVFHKGTLSKLGLQHRADADSILLGGDEIALLLYTKFLCSRKAQKAKLNALVITR